MAAAPGAPENLLRNGSFEGGMLYWHDVSSENYKLVKDGAAAGETAIQLNGGALMSAPFVAKRGEFFTVSANVKGEGKVNISMPPSAREPGQKSKRLWSKGAGFSAELTPEWQRVSFTWSADVPPEGFWPNPHYLVQIGGTKGKTIFIDGVTVTQGKEGTAEYILRREIEVLAECVNLPGWDGAAGNAFDKGATAKMVAHVSNPGKTARDVTVRWQLVDYEGETAVASPMDAKISLGAGKTVSLPTAIPLTRNGMVLARLTILDGENEIDRSDFPLTSMPYPKMATKPDFRERFGGSFAGSNGKGQNTLAKMQRIGFGWLRWQPHANGNDHLPTEPANLKDSSTWEWNWMDDIYKMQEGFGQSAHIVLFPPPAWIMEKGNSLPKDMRWPANDPRWDDFTIETVWDKFVKGAVNKYRGRSLIYEIENEPDLGSWEKQMPEYAKFTLRTAKLIRATDPKAKIMVDNVYGIPSRENSHFFKLGGLKYIDVMSWHDYHEGWLTDATGIKRMRQNMDEAGGKQVEIWFNEGWAFTNTAVDEPIACTSLTSSQSTNAIMDCTAEMTVAGQEKTVMFHLAYGDHGHSFWDYSGPGTMLWDWYGNPLPLVGAWNVMVHHIGISDEAGFIRPPGANFTIFQDLRNERGVMIAYADRGSKADVTVELPDMGAPLIAEDIMGNAAPAGKKLVLSKTGRPVILYTAAKTPGKNFMAKMDPLDRKHLGFVSNAPGAAPSFSLPPAWEGKAKGDSENSVAMANGKPVWKLEQLWPADMKKRENFKAMVWNGTQWNVQEGGFGGQPGANMKDGVLILGTRAAHGEGNDRHLRTAGLTFVAQKAGVYALHGTVACKAWEGKNKTTLHLLKKTATTVEKIASVPVASGTEVSLEGQSVELAVGEELTMLPQIEGNFAGGDSKFKDFSISLGDAKEAVANPGYKLPSLWEGTQKGSAGGNPVSANGQPIWRLDRLYPADAIMAANYSPMIWGGTSWTAPDHSQGGAPSATVADGKVSFGAMGPWAGEFNFPKIPVLTFIAPKSGIYKITGTASAKPWEGSAKTFPLSLRKKDTQRAGEVAAFQLPRDGTAVTISAEVELNSGHELLFVPMMQGLYNEATNVIISNLNISAR